LFYINILHFQEPVVITDSHLVSTALKWNLEYLKANMGNGDFTVYVSDNHKFMYYDEKKFVKRKDFTPPTGRQDMKFAEFVERLRNLKPGDNR
jgi:hypoxia-inducible factor 1-alpha inhibitor (HIF hydroxylase)